MNRRQRLEALYAELPHIECKGQCWDGCGAIPVLRTEQTEIRKTGFEIPDVRRLTVGHSCPALTMFRQCAIYEMRPLICRLWGLSDALPCTMGCIPEGGRLTVQEGYELLARGLEIDGDFKEAARIREPFSTPEKAAATTAAMLAYNKATADYYKIEERLARKRGPVAYVVGPGRLSKDPIYGRETK